MIIALEVSLPKPVLSHETLSACDYNHEEKLKTHEEKKLVSADQPSLRRTPGAKDRERFHTGCLFVRNHFI